MMLFPEWGSSLFGIRGIGVERMGGEFANVEDGATDSCLG